MTLGSQEFFLFSIKPFFDYYASIIKYTTTYKINISHTFIYT